MLVENKDFLIGPQGETVCMICQGYHKVSMVEENLYLNRGDEYRTKIYTYYYENCEKHIIISRRKRISTIDELQWHNKLSKPLFETYLKAHKLLNKEPEYYKNNF